ncbi:hypothetical protein BC628DRAFT_1357590 [Trametes gibbosa]|nr:hypothetical protein BC628DRAFT_1357590 [Trametes gibbosa]
MINAAAQVGTICPTMPTSVYLSGIAKLTYVTSNLTSPCKSSSVYSATRPISQIEFSTYTGLGRFTLTFWPYNNTGESYTVTTALGDSGVMLVSIVICLTNLDMSSRAAPARHACLPTFCSAYGLPGRVSVSEWDPLSRPRVEATAFHWTENGRTAI